MDFVLDVFQRVPMPALSGWNNASSTAKYVPGDTWPDIAHYPLAIVKKHGTAEDLCNLFRHFILEHHPNTRIAGYTISELRRKVQNGRHRLLNEDDTERLWNDLRSIMEDVQAAILPHLPPLRFASGHMLDDIHLAPDVLVYNNEQEFAAQARARLLGELKRWQLGDNIYHQMDEAANRSERLDLDRLSAVTGYRSAIIKVCRSSVHHQRSNHLQTMPL
jgi:hypothetical protein